MNSVMTAFTAVCAMAATASTQESYLPTSIAEWPAEEAAVLVEEQEGGAVAREKRSPFSLGPVAGYIRARDADRGTWFGGVQARLNVLPILAIEGSITFHQDEYQDGDIEVTQYPVQVTGLLSPFPDSHFRPYGLAGAGWYYTKFEYSGVFSIFEDETERLFGVHVGAGAELDLGPSASLFADFRWIFMDEPSVDNSQIEDEEFDAGQVTLGLSLRF